MLRDLIPAEARRWVYLALVAALVVATLLEGGFNVETLVKVAGALGLSLAAGNLPDDSEADG